MFILAPSKALASDMNSPRSINIAGGGLAGLTLGIALRQAGIPVVVHEAGTYPPKRVCGEFISGRGLKVLNRLHLDTALMAAGGRLAETAAFFSGAFEIGRLMLPQRALCLARSSLDPLLAAELLRLGGELRERSRCSEEQAKEGTVFATGRRNQAVVNGWRWFGLRVCAQGIQLSADLEMHVMRNGYVGICRLRDGTANVCGLFRSRSTQHTLAQEWPAWLRGPRESVLSRRLDPAEFIGDSFAATAGLHYRPFGEAGSKRCCIGDRWGLLAPITGNGMSMAFESAEIAAGPLAAYARGQVGWDEAIERVRREVRARFCLRTWLGYGLQSILLRAGGQVAVSGTLRQVPSLLRFLFAATR